MTVQTLDNNTRGRLDGMMQKTWSDWGTEHLFLSWKRAADFVVIATDSATITKHVKDIEAYLITLKEVKSGNGKASETMELETLPEPAPQAESAVIVSTEPNTENLPAVVADEFTLQTMNADTQMTIAGGLRQVFDELSKAKSPESIKALSLKASNMVKITGAMTGMARLELDIQKAAMLKKSNKK